MHPFESLYFLSSQPTVVALERGEGERRERGTVSMVGGWVTLFRVPVRSERERFVWGDVVGNQLQIPFQPRMTYFTPFLLYSNKLSFSERASGHFFVSSRLAGPHPRFNRLQHRLQSRHSREIRHTSESSANYDGAIDDSCVRRLPAVEEPAACEDSRRGCPTYPEPRSVLNGARAGLVTQRPTRN